ncbi:MAG TPA: HD domain-containing phosphohydrolase [bacterium]|nr:HD domain-containing phosphohydrolase [bacterium]
MKKIKIFDAEPGMILAKPVVVLHSKGRELMQPGFVLEKPHIKRLGIWGIESIFIETYDGDDDNNQIFNESVRMLARQTYEDAISSLAKISKNLISDKECDISQVARTISHILEVISLEQGVLSILSKLREADEYIYKHNVDVCVTALILGRAMNLNNDQLHDLGTACLLHDLGLAAYKNEKWDNSQITKEPENIRKHPLRSAEMASQIKGIGKDAITIINQHHEYVDGSGYPEGKKSDEIILLSRICAVSEAYNTLVSPYENENKVDPHEAMVKVVDPKFNRFDPEVLRAMISNMAIYPAGTFVQLNNAMRAVVISSTKDNPLRPRLLVLYESETKPIKPFPADLSQPGYQEWYIDKVVPSDNIMKSIEHIVRL